MGRTSTESASISFESYVIQMVCPHRCARPTTGCVVFEKFGPVLLEGYHLGCWGTNSKDGGWLYHASHSVFPLVLMPTVQSPIPLINIRVEVLQEDPLIYTLFFRLLYGGV